MYFIKKLEIILNKPLCNRYILNKVILIYTVLYTLLCSTSFYVVFSMYYPSQDILYHGEIIKHLRVSGRMENGSYNYWIKPTSGNKLLGGLQFGECVLPKNVVDMYKGKEISVLYRNKIVLELKDMGGNYINQCMMKRTLSHCGTYIVNIVVIVLLWIITLYLEFRYKKDTQLRVKDTDIELLILQIKFILFFGGALMMVGCFMTPIPLFILIAYI